MTCMSWVETCIHGEMHIFLHPDHVLHNRSPLYKTNVFLDKLISIQSV